MRAMALAATAAMLFVAVGPMAVSSPGAPGGTHKGYVDLFPVSGERVPTNYAVVQGPTDAWRVSGGFAINGQVVNALQAVRQAGTLIQLLDPREVVDFVDDRLLGLCFLPEQTINSSFYSGFTVNNAPILEFNLGNVLQNLLKVRINIPLQQIQIFDEAGKLLGALNLAKPVQFNQWSCLNILLLTDANQLLVILGNTLDSIGHVVNGVTHKFNLNGVTAMPRGTFGLVQHPSNTARVLFAKVHFQTVPDVPVALEAFAGPGDGQVTLQWEAPVLDGGSYVTGYNIYRGTDPQEMALVGTVLGGYETEFTDQAYTGLIPTTQKFYYRVTALNFVGESPWTVASCRIPYPMGLVLLDNTGLGCGTHGLVEAPTLAPFLP